MSQLNKQQLGVANQTSFPNNTTGFISPALLRGFNTDVIDSFTLQSQFDANSSSVDSRLDSLESFSSSLAIDYINQTELNQATASLSASLTTTINTKLNTSTFNTYTASTNGRLDTIESNYASKNAVNTFTQDQIIIGSLDIKESLIVDFSASFGSDVSMSGLDNYGDSRLGANASSVNTLNGFVYITNPDKFNLGSVNWLVYSASIASASAFIANYTGQPFNLFSQSVDVRLDSLELFSSSLNATYATDAELAGVSSSIMSTLNTFSSSYKVDSASFDTRINTNSSSFNQFSSSYTTESSSFQSQITTNSASFNSFSSSQYITDSSSFDGRLDVIETTYAKTGSNSFVGNQTITGVVSISSSATYDLDITGAFQATVASRVSSSAGVATISPSLISYTSNTASISSTLGKGTLAAVDATGAPSTFRQITLSANPSVIGIPSVSSITVPSILTPSGSTPGAFIAPIQFQHIGNYTDGRVTITTPLIVSSSTTISGSVNGIVGNITVVSNTASIDMSKGNFFTLNIPSASITYITATNIQPGQTVAVKLSQAANSSGSVTFDSSQFKFWSGSAQFNTGSQVTGSTDIFTFVTFDTSSLWTTIVKNLV
jgi:hypothetical protein